jgi:recombinational DNA repair protein (RecF pathway)
VLTEARLDTAVSRRRSVAAFRRNADVAELLDALTADADPQPELFDAATATLARTL